VNLKVQALAEKGEIVTSEAGNSMLPIIKSKQKHKLKSCTWDTCKVDDIVFCKVRGRYITHKVYAKNEVRGLLIGNNKGYMNGWTKSVYGKVVEIYSN
jgi:hypothetical protein